MRLPDFLKEDSLGYIHLNGHRIGLDNIIPYYNEGYSPEMLVEEFPTLSVDLVRKVIEFYQQNRAEVDAYVKNCDAENERHRANAPRVIDFEELTRRFEETSKVKKE
jgi:uncharacterized protein (DUF433 family)